jgi:hypothetical protein
MAHRLLNLIVRRVMSAARPLRSATPFPSRRL